MHGTLDVNIYRAHHRHVGAMAHVFLNSFDLDGSVKLMYTKDETWPVIQEILHDYMDDNKIEFRLAVTQDLGLIVGWMSFGIVPETGPAPQFAFNEMTSWATQRLLRGNKSDHRFRLAAELEDRSRNGQSQYMLSHRLVINTIVTDPDYRRLGVAGKLLRFAVDRAQSTDWGIWAQTPAVYVGLFWRNGFHEAGAFGLDLNAFKPLEEVAKGIHGKQLGIQTWRQMKLSTRAELLLERSAAETAEPASTRGQMPDPMGT
ncbi:MAG: hypothetical protein Q9175_000286 [Cornicularia normoerica]